MATSVSSLSTNFFPSAENGFTSTTSGSVSSGAATVGLNSVSGYTNGEIAVFVIDPTDAAKKQTFTGVIDTGGVQVTDVVWTAGTNQTHALGATVVDYATATHISMMTKGILVNHDQSGYHKTLSDANGNEWIKQTATGSAVNEITIANAATGTNPVISATGDNSNIGITMTPKGTGAIKHTANYDPWVLLATAPTTITSTGNRSYTVLFPSVDFTDRLSIGTRLKLTRTVTAPTQCTDLEAGSSQYYNDTSVNKMTFTDDFVVSAWVKLESYMVADMTIASRYNGTSGWRISIQSTGQVIMVGYNAGAGNYSFVQSYQAVPLGKWVHIAGQLDMSAFTATTTTSYIMIDGLDVPALVARAGSNPTALIQAGNLEIGGANGGTIPFDGKLAQVAVYSAKVTQATILASINRTLTGSETDLASAYSFNNSIADLNTTTPNDLTAQNSAVATNADSPFGVQADGTTAGTTEYGIVTKTAFSTNTTVTVQVPEGCAIPTTGGVSAVSYSAHKAPFNMPVDPGRWELTSLNRNNVNSTLTTATWSNINTGKLTVPIGSWLLGHSEATQNNATVSGTCEVNTTLALTSAAEDDIGFTSSGAAAPSTTLITPAKVEKAVSLTTATPYYLNIKVSGSGTLTGFHRGDIQVTTVKAGFALV